MVTTGGSFSGTKAFSLRRPALILRFLNTARERPDFARLSAIDDPEEFVWAILPHAARTFAACIALLPARSALTGAVAYLYCRMLDTYEDLVPDPASRDAALEAFATRLTASGARPLSPAPVIDAACDRDDRDRAHLLLVQRADLVDHVFLRLDDNCREIVRDLVHDMAQGMLWSSRTFEQQGGVLASEAQLARYCRHVLGNPAAFGIRLLLLHHGAPPRLTARQHEDAMLVGELVQLANVTRDVEKDLRRGVAYDSSLRADLGRDPSTANDPALVERCRSARERYIRMALSRAPAYARLIDSVPLPRVSVARASALLMLLFTERFYRGAARRAGLAGWRGPESIGRLFWRTFVAAWSRRGTLAEFARIEAEFLAVARSRSAPQRGAPPRPASAAST